MDSNDEVAEGSGSGLPPALYEHCVRTYEAMLAQAKTLTVTSKGVELEDRSVDPDEDTTASEIIVYEGFLTQLITGKLNLSVPYYTSITRALVRMGCIRQMRRGGGASPSQWELIYQPTEKAFYDTHPKKAPKQTKDEAHAEQIRNLAQRVTDLEQWQKQVNASLIDKLGTE